MGRDQRVDWRPTIVAFTCVNAPPKNYEEDDAPTLTEFCHNVLDMADLEFRRLLYSTSDMFRDACDCSHLTALSLAYTLHTQANTRPI